MVHRLSFLLLVLVLVLTAPPASAAPDVGDDLLPELSIDDVTVVEGDTGAVTASFTVALSVVSDQTVTVDFATADDTATAADDYLSVGSTLVFDPGQTTQSVSVSVTAIRSTSRTRPTSSIFRTKQTPRSPTGRGWGRSPTTTSLPCSRSMTSPSPKGASARRRRRSRCR